MPEILAADLLDPKNDPVFFRVFAEEPALLADLINVVRSEVRRRRARAALQYRDTGGPRRRI